MAVTAGDKRAIGADLLALANRFDLWLPRREERVELVTSALARRTVRVDIDLSDFYDDQHAERQLPLWRGRLLVPIALVLRDEYTTIDVHGDDGRLLPRVTVEEERDLMYHGLWHLAEEVLAPQSLTTTGATALRARVAEREDSPRDEQLDRLFDDPIFSQALRDVTRLFHLLAPLDPSQGLRHVMTYNFLEPIPSPPTRAETSRRREHR